MEDIQEKISYKNDYRQFEFFTLLIMSYIEPLTNWNLKGKTAMLINLLSNPLLPVALGIIGLIAALIVYGTVKASPAGEGKVKEIGDEIHLGAMVFMSAEYKRLAIFCLVCIFLETQLELYPMILLQLFLLRMVKSFLSKL